MVMVWVCPESPIPTTGVCDCVLETSLISTRSVLPLSETVMAGVLDSVTYFHAAISARLRRW
jgi:hypothetical protein